MSRATGLASWCALAVLVVLQVAAFAGLRLNLSPSVPRGVYWIEAAASLRVGQYVAVCPPRTPLFETALERGYLALGTCDAGYGELIKVVAAQEGALVVAGRQGVRVDGDLWPRSMPREKDQAGRAIPQRELPWREVLGPASILVMSKHEPSGFDGRYFGALERTAIVGSAVPIFIW